MKTILHLTDIHFGWEGPNLNGLAEREGCLNSLLEELKKLDPQWKPTIICLSGDVGWRGAASDYSQAKEWLDKLLDIFGLGYDSLIVSPGNHDLDRSIAEKLPRPSEASEADKVLGLPIADHYEKPFSHFIEFCKLVKIPPYKLGDYDSYLVGERMLEGIRFVSLNSAWFAKDDNDQNKLWIGLPHLRYMDANKQLPLIQPDSIPFTVATLHHPKEWLHLDEQQVSTGRPITWDYLAQRCHVLLTGHTHSAVRPADRVAECAWHFTDGSVFAGASHFNSVRLIQVKSKEITHKALEFDPTSSSNKWRSHEAVSLSLAKSGSETTLEVEKVKIQFSVSDVRAALCADAEKKLEQKSRLLRQTGTLPKIVDRLVSLRVSKQYDEYDRDGRLVEEKNSDYTMPFYEAARESRRVLLLGDLGTGKSTLMSQLVVDTISRSDSVVAIFIPVKLLKLPSQLSPRDLLESIDHYVVDNVLLKIQKFSVDTLLTNDVEVLLVLDGLDELPREVAARLLKHAASLPENWPKIQVIAAGRPIELVGVSYSDWRIVHAMSLTDSEKKNFIKQELIAEGTPHESVEEKASSLLQLLKDMPTLDSISNTPLAIRLIYPRLKATSSATPMTLGDLLYGLILERLGNWQIRDDKPSTFSLFDEMAPTPEQKAEFLGILAQKTASGLQMQLEEAKVLLQGAAVSFAGPKKHQFAEEALGCFEWLGLISKNEIIEFPLQPLAEICAAAGYLRDSSSEKDLCALGKTQWRVVSFVACIARKRGLLHQLGASLKKYIEFLLDESGYLPASCYIVVEANTVEIACHTVKSFKKLGYRPLVIFQDERKASARNIAKSLILAGSVGFDWFYKEYLNPKYPFISLGSAILTDIFAEWAAIIRPNLEASQKDELASLVMPYLATREANFYGVLTYLSVLVPEKFGVEDRIWYQSIALDDSRFSEFVTHNFTRLKDSRETRALLLETLLHRSKESVLASRLWMDWNPESEIPHSIIRAVFRSFTKAQVRINESELVKKCYSKLGEERWMNLARWFLASEDIHVAAGAAKVLYDAGERRLSVLGDVTMHAMHDGNYVAEAEPILADLIKREGAAGVRWLAFQMGNASELWGGYSGWWRILLENILLVKDGPTVLASCSRSIGPFLLSRHPEIREKLMQVVGGSQGSVYREALRGCLNSLDPSSRLGAAMILVATSPQSESEALYVAVRSRANSRHRSHHDEWEKFCLTLQFGPSVLLYLKNELRTLEKRARALALVLLVKGGIPIEEEQQLELMSSLFDFGNWFLRDELPIRQIFDSEPHTLLLMQKLEGSDLKSAENAAEYLWRFHQPTLSPAIKALCMALRYMRPSGHWTLMDLVRRLDQDSASSQEIANACGKVALKSGHPISFLGLLIKCVKENIGWKDMVWALLAENPKHSMNEPESNGFFLLELGMSSDKFRGHIGEATKELLSDVRFQDDRNSEAYQWLTLLTDEFLGLDLDSLRRAVLARQVVHFSASTALIARLGEVPEHFSRRSSYHERPASLDNKHSTCNTVEELIQKLKDYARNSRQLHPDLSATIQDCLLFPQFDESFLASISEVGTPGILITLALRFSYGTPAKVSEAIPLLDLWQQLWLEEQSKPEIKQLQRIWKMSRSLTLQDAHAKEEYLLALDTNLLEGEVWKLALAWDLLEIRGSLTVSQIPIIFADYAEHRTYLHEVLFARICDWLAKGIDKDALNVLIEESQKVILILDETPWKFEWDSELNVYAWLLFPIILWSHGENASVASQAVFLRGIRGVFDVMPSSHDSRRSNSIKLLVDLGPLLAKVPPAILRETLQRGLESFEPSVATFCRLIQVLGRNLSV